MARTKKTPTTGIPTTPTRHAASLGTSTVLAGVHETVEGLANIELSPPHPPRESTPEYQQTHRLLIYEKDAPCKVCGVRRSTLGNPHANPFGARQLESHHYPVERSLIDAVDWRKIHNDYPAVYSQASLEMWVDSPQNMLILCDIHHRSLSRGIHHLPTQDFIIQQYLLDGYVIATDAKDAATAIATDEAIERAAGIEQAVDAAMGLGPGLGLGSASAVAPVPPVPSVLDDDTTLASVATSAAQLAPATVAGSSPSEAAKPMRARSARTPKTPVTATTTAAKKQKQKQRQKAVEVPA